MKTLDVIMFSRPPFDMSTTPDHFFESRSHGEALARMRYFASDQSMGLGVLTGEIGAGKTMTTNVLTERLSPDRYDIINIPTAAYSFESLLEELNYQLGDPQAEQKETTAYHLARRFEHLLTQRVTALNRHLLILLDEAQLLPDTAFEPLKCLTNLNRNGQFVLSIILIGQPELRNKLRRIPQVQQRIGMAYHLDNLHEHEIDAYIHHRLLTAGVDSPEIFEGSCIQEIYQFSGGSPRQINRICRLAVDSAALRREPFVRASTVRAVINDIQVQMGVAV
jgi:general secretion pathway protein A